MNSTTFVVGRATSTAELPIIGTAFGAPAWCDR